MAMNKIPQEFWDDQEWALDNYERWIKEYPDQWIAVVDKRVVAAGKDIEAVELSAKKKTGREYIPVIFIEGCVHVY
jgi:hypothetical protein